MPVIKSGIAGPKKESIDKQFWFHHRSSGRILQLRLHLGLTKSVLELLSFAPPASEPLSGRPVAEGEHLFRNIYEPVVA